MATQTATVHISAHGTYHPDPQADVVWTVNDTRGYMDTGPACIECNACECDICTNCDEPICHEAIANQGEYCNHNGRPAGDNECIGLSIAFVCLDGGETLCEACGEQAGITIIACTCD